MSNFIPLRDDATPLRRYSRALSGRKYLKITESHRKFEAAVFLFEVHFGSLLTYIDQGSVSWTIFHRNSNSMEIWFCSHPRYRKVIAMIFCTWHCSCAIVAGPNCCSDMMPNSGVILKPIVRRIWITMEKSFEKMGPRAKVYKDVGRPSLRAVNKQRVKINIPLYYIYIYLYIFIYIYTYIYGISAWMVNQFGLDIYRRANHSPNTISTSNGSWCMGIKGEMSGTVCVTFTWYMCIYELFIAFVCFGVCSLL